MDKKSFCEEKRRVTQGCTVLPDSLSLQAVDGRNLPKSNSETWIWPNHQRSLLGNWSVWEDFLEYYTDIKERKTLLQRSTVREVEFLCLFHLDRQMGQSFTNKTRRLREITPHYRIKITLNSYIWNSKKTTVIIVNVEQDRGKSKFNNKYHWYP